MNQIVAIGDIHGCYTELKKTLEPLYDSNAEVLFLGDLIDRSPDKDGDIKVLELVRDMQQHPECYGLSKVTVLKGNHENLLLDAIEYGRHSEAYELWVWNGGDPAFYKQAKEYETWLTNLDLYAIRGNYLFVHAGVRPNTPLEEQVETDLTWIRDPFLNAEHHGLPYTVVHGHTIVDTIEFHPGRIALDTGCFYTGNLSSMRFYYDESMGSQASEARTNNDRDRECALAE
jgi:serine/threonine protein phosphatase 1